jgi:hypothetical protein
MFKETIDPNVFDQDFLADNGVKPPEPVIGLLRAIKQQTDAKPTVAINYYIRKFMTMFLNNRVGTVLTEPELANVKRGAIKEFQKGQMVTMKDADGNDRFVLYVKQKQPNVALIITRNPKTMVFDETTVPITSLFEYSLVAPITQTFKMDMNFSEESLLETYTVE